MLCEQTVSPVCPSCRALLARGITGPFETWREGLPYACMRGDIEKAAGLTVKEPDRGAIAFARWNAFPSSPVEARTRGDIKPGSGEPADANASLWSDRRAMQHEGSTGEAFRTYRAKQIG